MLKAIIGLTTAAMLGGSALAAELPASAVPLDAEEMRRLYAGKTLMGPESDTFLAADGTTKGIFGKPKIIGTFTGRWTIEGNEVCMVNQSPEATSPEKDCIKTWKDGRRFFVLWSVRSDGKPVDATAGYQPYLPKRRAGDVVSQRYRKAGGL